MVLLVGVREAKIQLLLFALEQFLLHLLELLFFESLREMVELAEVSLFVQASQAAHNIIDGNKYYMNVNYMFTVFNII